MTPFNTLAKEITEAVLRGLIDAQVPEGKTIDYKAELPGNADSAKKDFLADLSSFANATGGHIIYGMTEQAGLPKVLMGLEINVDQAILRLESMARDGIRPPIPGLGFIRVALESGRAAVVAVIPKSWNPPHQVIFQKDYRFYTRGSAGKQHFDVDELRRIVFLSQEIGERVRQFRAGRVAAIMTENTPGRLSSGARQIIHFIPLGTFGAGGAADMNGVTRKPQLLVEVMNRGGSVRHNVDGLLAHASSSSNPTAYAQLFRDGSIEVVQVLGGGQLGKSLPSLAFEKEVFQITKHALKIIEISQVTVPIAMLLSFAGIKGWRMAVHDPGGQYDDNAGFDRDPLLIPELIIESLTTDDVARLVKPLLDSTWQAGDFPQSLHYDESGNWVGRR